ncbi:Protein of unknown function [Mycolicibacterium neoaurum]|uniref:DUF3060 domain-containing protein n=1 Tax=Mycolicibacterium neoaurum TaxID=1795 RepID=UPI00068FAAFB|nr:DUF3060 domain-containing protein [Mycolicibacterium neoaurum]SDE45109.1 Protein of unknown function [Mycolicibacterium neoaurum]
MNPQDDPEARIRALEPTELGAEQPSPSTYGTGSPATPPLPPPTQPWPEPPYGQAPHASDPYGLNSYGQSNYGQSPYGADPYGGAYAQPYPSAPQRSGLRPWMVIVPLALVLLFFGGAAAAFWLFSADDSTPDVAGGGGVLTDEPVRPAVPGLPEIPQLPPIVVDPGGPNTPVEPGGTITITGIGTNRTVACDDHIVILSGANNTIDVTGHCTAVTVSGFENVVTAQSTEEITVSGFENRVTYRDGSPTINQSGSGNAIEQG